MKGRRIARGMVGVLSGLSALALLGVVLIGSSSEVSYYLHLALFLLLLIGLYRLGKTLKLASLVGAALIAAAVTALMPFEMTFSEHGLLYSPSKSAPAPGDIIPSVGTVTKNAEYKRDLFMSFGVHFALLTLFTTTLKRRPLGHGE